MKKSLYLLVTLAFSSFNSYAYEYKIKDSYVSTIFGTSEENKADIKSAPFEAGLLTLDKSKQVPDNFWFNKDLRYAKAIRKEHAPLAFLIAGTGGNHISPKIKLMANILYSEGYSVITLPSPSHSNFIVSASSDSAVGSIEKDSKDLKKVVKEITRDIIQNDDAKITSYVVGGYSLGAAHSAFLSYYADIDKNYPIKFSKVLMVNPPYDILESAIKIDKMFNEHIGTTKKDLADFYEGVYSLIADTYDELGGMEVGPEILLETYKRRNIETEGVQAAIGAAFRFSSADMVYSIDVMRQMGIIVPKDVVVGEYDILKDYYLSSLTYGFEKYAENMLTDIYNKPLKQLSDETSMKAIEGYLKDSDKIFLMHNQNDFILKDGDIKYFKSLFGDRAVIYPYGGHCGNMDHKENVAHVKELFKLNNKGN